MKGRLNKPIYAIMTSLVLILGTFAIAFPAQEANAGNGGLPVLLEITCKVKGNESVIFGAAGVFFIGEKKADLGSFFTPACVGDGDMRSRGVEIPVGTEEVQIVNFCQGSEGPIEITELEKKFKEGQTSFKGKVRCNVNSGFAIAVLTSDFD